MSSFNQGNEPQLSLAQIQARLWSLKQDLQQEMEFALPCYEDGSLSPRRILGKLLTELTELETSAFRLVIKGALQSQPELKAFVSSPVLGSIQPPATAESLSMPSWYSPDDMELTQGSDWDLESHSPELPS